MKPVRLFSSDIDGTVAGNSEAEARFADFWDHLDPETRPLLVYNSGRLVDDIRDFLPTTNLPAADILIGGVGTMLQSDSYGHHREAFEAALGRNFDAEAIHELMREVEGASLQPDIYQHGLKSSWYLHDATEDMLAGIEAKLAVEGHEVKIVYSSSRDLDILPRRAGKGAALQFLADALGIGLDEMLVAGDTGNDAAMFEVPDIRGIVVGNAKPELRALARTRPDVFQAVAHEADGVLEGFAHFGLR